MQNVNLERSELHGSMTEGCWVILCSPERQPGVLLGAGGPPEVGSGSHHRVGVDVLYRPPVVVLAGPHSEGVVSRLVAQLVFLEDNMAGAGTDLDV